MFLPVLFTDIVFLMRSMPVTVPVNVMCDVVLIRRSEPPVTAPCPSPIIPPMVSVVIVSFGTAGSAALGAGIGAAAMGLTSSSDEKKLKVLQEEQANRTRKQSSFIRMRVFIFHFPEDTHVLTAFTDTSQVISGYRNMFLFFAAPAFKL